MHRACFLPIYAKTLFLYLYDIFQTNKQKQFLNSYLGIKNTDNPKLCKNFIILRLNASRKQLLFVLKKTRKCLFFKCDVLRRIVLLLNESFIIVVEVFPVNKMF